MNNISNLDLINGGFELTAGLFSLLNVVKLYKDKQVLGISLFPQFIFSAWAIFNLYFYSNIDLWYSFIGSIMMTSVNVTWFVMAVYYRYYYYYPKNG